MFLERCVLYTFIYRPSFFEASLPHLVSVEFAHTKSPKTVTLSLSLLNGARNPQESFDHQVVSKCVKAELSLHQTKLSKDNCAVCRTEP